ncbi:hypothetical protein EDC91_15716 [Shewanella fodinae]|uniref:Uncharacterized protein n=1 Tax=Shewanella fodinae TaxID=552357 RepID=A0A4R2F4P8_9GAMM|nr:hypothetical protein EDC91_15716 [Shewanella fodinae]
MAFLLFSYMLNFPRQLPDLSDYCHLLSWRRSGEIHTIFLFIYR